MKIPSIELDYIDPIKLREYDSVDILLPDGRIVAIFSDKIYIRSINDQIKHADGYKIWSARSGPRESKQYPYGQTYLTERT